ncbi:MAG: hypothetical protein HRU24_01120 [Gammaproteobacteria bacterium]|nr:hypothetical protein [Gammaproteobacteria bacterium]
MTTLKTLKLVKNTDKKTKEVHYSKPKPTRKANDAHRWLIKLMKKLKNSGINTKWDCPLSVNIYHAIRATLASDFISSKNLNSAIRYHVKSTKYLLMLRADANRYDIDGEKSGTVTTDQYQNALEQLHQHHSSFMQARRKRKNTIIDIEQRRKTTALKQFC